MRTKIIIFLAIILLISTVGTVTALTTVTDCRYLNQAGETYLLTADITTEQGCFVVSAPDVKFDMGGHTVIYDDGPAINIGNPSFEESAPCTAGNCNSVPNWSFSSAPDMSIVANTAFPPFGGTNTLVIPANSPSQYIESDPIFFPQGLTYRIQFLFWATETASNHPVNILIPGAENGTCALFQSKREGSSSAHWNAVDCKIIPATDITSTIQIGISGVNPNDIIIDMIDVSQKRTNPGEIAASPGGFNFIGTQSGGRNFELYNGTIIQGKAKSYDGQAVSDISVDSAPSQTAYHDLNILVSGSGTRGISTQTKDGLKIYNNVIGTTHTYYKSREALIAMIRNHNSVNTYIFNNTVSNTYQNGVEIRNSVDILIENNTINMSSTLSNGFGIIQSGSGNDITIRNNIIQGDGRGMQLGNTIANNLIEGNILNLREAIKADYQNPDADPPVCAQGIKVEHGIGFTIRNNDVYLEYHDGTYVPCPLDLVVDGGPGSEVLVEGNNFTGIYVDPEPFSIVGSHAFFMYSLDGTQQTVLRNNKFESNKYAIEVYSTPGTNIYFDSNTIVSQVPENQFSIFRFVDSGPNVMDDVTLYNTTVVNVNLSRPSYGRNTDNWNYNIAWPIKITSLQDVTPLDATYTIYDKDMVVMTSGNVGPSGIIYVPVKQRDIFSTGLGTYGSTDYSPITVSVTHPSSAPTLSEVVTNLDSAQDLIFQFGASCPVPYDTPPACDDCIDLGELTLTIGGWYSNHISIATLLSNIRNWKSCN